MSHLDEGQLHAYLDAGADAAGVAGAHLATCAECRAKLEEARRLRDRAGAILRAGGPGRVAPPPFEEIARRRERITPARAPRAIVLAWAATIALALGIGWYARSLAVRERPVETDIAARPIAARAPSRDVAEAAGARGDVAAARPSAAAPSTTPTAPLADRLAPAPATEIAVAGRAADSAQAADTRLNTRELSQRMAQRVSPPAPRAEPAAADERVEWAAVTRNEAERALDDQLAALADVETVGVTARQGPEGAEVRTVQRLADGRTVELIQQRLPAERQEQVRLRRAAPSTAEAAAPTTAALPSTLVSVEWSNSRVTARGALPADSLRALLRRLRRAPPER